MEHFFSLISTILTLVIIIFLGFLARRTSLFNQSEIEVINKLIIYLALPFFVFDLILKTQIPKGLSKIPLVALSTIFLSLFIAFLLSQTFRLKGKIKGSFLLVCSMGNTGYMGYPIALKILGKSNFIRAMFYDIFGSALFFFTFGIYLAETYGEAGGKESRLKEILTFPPLLGLILGFIFRGVTLPPFLLKAIETIGKAAIPLLMISVGASLEFFGFSSFGGLIVLATLVKLFLTPFLAYIAGRLFLLNPLSLKACLLQASMPSGLLTLALGIKYKLQNELIATTIFTTTLLSLISIPLIQYIFSLYL